MKTKNDNQNRHKNNLQFEVTANSCEPEGQTFI